MYKNFHTPLVVVVGDFVKAFRFRQLLAGKFTIIPVSRQQNKVTVWPDAC